VKLSITVRWNSIKAVIISFKENLMRWNVAIAALAVVVGVSMLTALAQNEQAAQDRKKLQGTWVAAEGPKGMQMTCSENKWTLRANEDGEEQFAKGTFTIDPTQDPKTMDLTVVEAKGKEVERYIGKTSRAIYEVSGDTFKWCANEPGKEDRPKAFAAQDGDRRFLLVTFKRGKDKE
jgi:uncharacterized protein (TIGR03067 family)